MHSELSQKVLLVPTAPTSLNASLALGAIGIMVCKQRAVYLDAGQCCASSYHNFNVILPSHSLYIDWSAIAVLEIVLCRCGCHPGRSRTCCQSSGRCMLTWRQPGGRRRPVPSPVGAVARASHTCHPPICTSPALWTCPSSRPLSWFAFLWMPLSDAIIDRANLIMMELINGTMSRQLYLMA